jgi:hypothetical protein
LVVSELVRNLLRHRREAREEDGYYESGYFDLNCSDSRHT